MAYLSKGKRLGDCGWGFTIKYKPDGTIESAKSHCMDLNNFARHGLGDLLE